MTTPNPYNWTTHTPVVNHYDPDMDAHPHISHFGALKTSPVYPIAKGNFPGTALDVALWSLQTLNGGNVSVAKGVAAVKTSTNAAGSVKLWSVQEGQFEAGQVTTFQSGVYAGAPLAGNRRRWGVMDLDEQNGLFFEMDGETFSVVARAGGTDTSVASTAFNVDTTFTPAASNNTYRIFYSAGRAVFCAAQQGKLRALHRMVDGAYPLVEDLDLHMYYENTNTGSTTDTEMRIRGASISIFGEARFVEKSGATTVAPIDESISLGLVPGERNNIKFGRNSDIDTGTTPEDIWEGQGLYTGMNATANEDIAISSSSANDSGTVVSSGTATGGNTSTLTDTGATFVTDGVAVGDLLVNDTQGSHGVVASLTETVITVHQMTEGGAFLPRNNAGDAYRVVTAASTGAAVVKLLRILDADYTRQINQYAVMNGTSTVTVSANAMRCSRGQVILAGSNETNVGTITATQATTTANVFFAIQADYGQTTIAADTVPAGTRHLLKRLRIAMTRATGAAGSASARVMLRRRGEAWRSIRVFEISNSAGMQADFGGGEVIPAAADYKVQCSTVSDNNTIVDALMEVREMKE